MEDLKQKGEGLIRENMAACWVSDMMKIPKPIFNGNDLQTALENLKLKAQDFIVLVSLMSEVKDYDRA